MISLLVFQEKGPWQVLEGYLLSHQDDPWSHSTQPRRIFSKGENSKVFSLTRRFRAVLRWLLAFGLAQASFFMVDLRCLKDLHNWCDRLKRRVCMAKIGLCECISEEVQWLREDNFLVWIRYDQKGISEDPYWRFALSHRNDWMIILPPWLISRTPKKLADG
jgi:hypothetical protein